MSTETAKENMQPDDIEIPSATTDVTPPTTKTATGTADAIHIIQKQSGLTKQNIFEFGLRVVSCPLVCSSPVSLSSSSQGSILSKISGNPDGLPR